MIHRKTQHTGIGFEPKQREADEEYLQRAIAWCRKEYKRRRQTEHCHCSHTAKDVLQECENVFPDLRMFGVEGFCDDTGQYGVTYLNTGDTYERTILFKSGPNGGAWSLGDWGSLADAGSKYVG